MQKLLIKFTETGERHQATYSFRAPTQALSIKPWGKDRVDEKIEWREVVSPESTQIINSCTSIVNTEI